MIPPLIFAAIAGYLLGSLPFGYLVAKAKGVNIFEVGSKSPGATNVRRVLGRGPGNLVLVLDALKGAVAAGWPIWLLPTIVVVQDKADAGSAHGGFAGATAFFGATGKADLAVACLLAALVGHSCSCFTKFRGGKGVATAAGGLLVLMSWVLALGLAVWLLTFKLFRYVSLASIAAAIALPLAACFLGEPPVLLGLASVISVFVTVRHRANIVRLLNGTENKFVKKPAAPEAPRS